MSEITIQCRLVASETTRQHLWQLMAEKNTPLINELLIQISRHPEFETWRQKQKGKQLDKDIVEELCKPLKTDPRFIGQPARFYTSATALVTNIYKSWFALIQRYQSQLNGKLRWLEMLNSDAELVEHSGVSLDVLRVLSAEILAQFAPQDTKGDTPTKGKKSKKRKKSQNVDSEINLSKHLFDAYENTEDNITRCAISYLLKNGSKINDKEEKPEKFAQRRRKLEIQILRLTEKLAARIPKGRDLTDAQWLETLFTATHNVPASETEATFWQNSLLRQSSKVPFPVNYETNENLVWFKNQFGRICLKFTGLREHTFQVYCDSRQLHWFQRFVEDQEIKKNSNKQHSNALFTLRSGRIAWQEGEGKGEPWNVNHLILYCSVDSRLWTQEGTNLVKEEKAEKSAESITQTKAKGDLSKTQLTYIKRNQTSLARINNPFPRPTQPLYKGQSHILVGVSLGLEYPATVAILDGTTGKVLTYRNIKQLLGDNYKLLNRQRQQKHLLSHQRHIAQRMAAPNQFGDSELGEYIDRLLAKEIIAIAQTYKAGSIVLPKLGDMREQVQSEIKAKAEQKSDLVEVQQKYAKQYRVSVHQWSYGRLIANIQSQANKAGIAIEEGKQPIRASPQEQAKELAINAYQSRKA